MKKNAAVALDSLGCKLNQAEIQHLAGQLAAAGYRIVSSPEEAEIYVLNTCTVTHIADRKSRHMLNLARRRNPTLRMFAIGCYAEREPRALDRIEGVELVLGNESKWHLPELLERISLAPFSQPHAPLQNRTRAFIKIQDGCRNFCAYCIVPLVRRQKVSVPPEQVLGQIRERATAGFREVVLTGTEIGDYAGEGLGLPGLVNKILRETGIARRRLSSLQPHHITPELLKLWQDPRLCPHFHLSLQSGSDTVLKRMKRRYTAAGYKRAVKLIHQSVPDVAITTDVIVGFPGETEEEFRQTFDFCLKMQFARIHVFPFSPRPGTAAATMPGQVPDALKKGRVRQMLALARESADAFGRAFTGRTLEVLWEQETSGVWSGLTGNYIKVYTKSGTELTNSLTAVRMIRPYRDGLWGEISKTITDSISP